MAARDVQFYNFLIEALRHKVSARGRKDTYYSNGKYSLPYLSLKPGQPDIFYFARKYFPQIYNINAKRVKDTPEQDLESNLLYAQRIIYAIDNHKDSELEKYAKIETSVNETDQFHQEIEQSVAAHVEDIQNNPDNHNFSGAMHDAPTGGSLNGLLNKTYQTTQPVTDKADRLKKQKEEMTKKEEGIIDGPTSFLSQPLANFKKNTVAARAPEQATEIAKEASFQVSMATNKVVTRIIPEALAPFGQEILNSGSRMLGSLGPEEEANETGAPTQHTGGGQQRKRGNPVRPGRNVTKTRDRRLLFWALGILIPILLIGFFLFGNITLPTTPVNSNSLLVIEKSGPASVENGQPIRYQLNVTYRGVGKAKNILLTDTIPEGTDFVSSSDGTTPKDKALSWNVPDLAAAQTWSISFTVTPLRENIWVTNQAKATYTASTTTSSKLIDSSSTTLATYFNQAAEYAGIPPALMKAIGRTESGVMSYTDEEVLKFSKPGWWEGLLANAPVKEQNHPDILRGYGYNTCQYRNDCPQNDVRGPMQFLLETWNNLKSKLGFEDNRDPDRRNLKDAIYGSAVFHKQNAEYAATRGVITLGVWDETSIRTVARMYCAGPGAATNPSLAQNSACGYSGPGSLTYDDRVWRYFKDYSDNKGAISQ